MLHLHLNQQPIASDGPAPPVCTIAAWQQITLHCVPPAGASLHLSLAGVLQSETLEPFLRPGDPAWYWRWNPQNHTGRFELLLRATFADGQEITQRSVLHVVPRKLDQQQYAVLLADIQQHARHLALALGQSSAGATLQPAAQTDPSVSSDPLERLCSLLETHLPTLEQATRQLARRPPTALHLHAEQVPPDQARDFSGLHRVDGADVVPAPDALRQTNLPALPARIEQRRPTASSDTYENRLLKHLLEALHHLAHVGAAQDSPHAPALAARSQQAAHRLETLLRLPLLAEVGPLTRFAGASHHIRTSPAYRQVYRVWQALQHEPVLLVDSPLVRLPIHDLPHLYECWCVLQMVAALRALPGVVLRSQQLVAPASRAPALLHTLALPTDRPLLVADWRGLMLRLRYQPRYTPLSVASGEPFGSLDDQTHVPDMALEVTAPGLRPYLLVLDAKYRREASGSLPPDALADAYTYLGSIGSAGVDATSSQRAVRSVLLLYPASTPPQHYASGVGVVGLLPGAQTGLSCWLHKMLGDLDEPACYNSP